MKRRRASTSAVTEAEVLVTRTDVVNPQAGISFAERLALAGAVDLRNNHYTVVNESGFVEVLANDTSKKFQMNGRKMRSGKI